MDMFSFSVEMYDGRFAVATEFPMEPYGTRLFCMEDDSEDSKRLLQQIDAVWPRLWPEMLSRLQETADELDLGNAVDSESLVGRGKRLEAGKFMSDRCDTYISLESDDHPDWDYFLKDSEIIHFQPVF